MTRRIETTLALFSHVSDFALHEIFCCIIFSNVTGRFSEVGGTEITTIDARSIDTGTITADKIKLTGTGSLSITSLANASGNQVDIFILKVTS